MSKQITQTELDKIRAAAEKATKGEWKQMTGKVVAGAYVVAECDYPDARFIALTDPTTMLRILDALEAKDKKNENLKAEVVIQKNKAETAELKQVQFQNTMLDNSAKQTTKICVLQVQLQAKDKEIEGLQNSALYHENIKYKVCISHLSAGVAKLWDSISSGMYDARSLVGDTTLDMQESLMDMGIDARGIKALKGSE